MKLKSRRERILMTVTVLVLLVIFGWLGYGKVSVYLTDLDGQIGKLERSLREKQKTEKEDMAIADRYVKVKKELNIPGSESEVKSAIRQELTGLLADGKIAQNINIKEPIADREKFLTTYPFNIDGTKAITIRDLAHFLDKMERESEVLEIDSIQLSSPRRPREDVEDAQYEFSVPQIVISRLVYTNAEEGSSSSSSRKSNTTPAESEF